MAGEGLDKLMNPRGIPENYDVALLPDPWMLVCLVVFLQYTEALAFKSCT